MSELLSYQNILNDIKNFKKAGSAFGDDFNIYDTPSHKYFKILFYFGSTPEFYDNNEYSSGLLAPTWELDTSSNSYYNYNSAWAYLKLNNEEERAEKLEQFVTLLSDINSNSPWYFSSISGVYEALDRKVTVDGKLDMSENKKLTITCLPDAFDNRLTTLLELYRDITWSWVHKKQVIPSNLIKFDMAIYIFESPNKYMHRNSDIIDTKTGYNVSYKMIEFHDCEFNYNSIKSGFNELSNTEGFTSKYSIDITYNDCYEISYNNIMMRKIGDVILTDLLNSQSSNLYISEAQSNNESDIQELAYRNSVKYDSEINAEQHIKPNKSGEIRYFGNLENYTNYNNPNTEEQYKTEYKPGFINNAIGQVVGHLKAGIKNWATQKIMGNIFGFSLTQLKDQVGDFLQGNVIKTGMTIAQFAREQKNKKQAKEQSNPTGNIFPIAERETTKTTQSKIGNIFKTSIANNL